MLELLRDTDGGTGFLHEGLDPADPTCFTRPWFSRATSMFCEPALKYAGLRPRRSRSARRGRFSP